MMRTVIMQYPGDPPCPVDFTTGAEFKRIHRGGAPGFITVTGWDKLPGPPTSEKRIEFTEVICDSCNAEVADEDECTVSPHQLLCMECTAKWVTPYIQEEK